MNLPRALLLAAALLSVDALASPIQTNYGTGDDSIPGGAIPASNLLSTNLLSATRTGSGDAYFYREDSGYTVDLARLYDGQFGTAGGNQAYTVMPNVVSLTFNLNLAARPAGYDIASIRTYAGWDSGRDGQAYTVEYSTATNPGQFVALATVNRFDNTNFPGYMSYMPMMVPLPYPPYYYMNYVPMYQSDTSRSSTLVHLQDSSGTLASGVAALRFNFAGVENSGTAYREIVVEGIAPTTVVGTVADLASFNVAGVVTFEGGGFAPTSSAGVTDLVVAAGFTGTLDASGGDITSTGAVTINGTSLTLTGSATSTIALFSSTGPGGIINAGGINTLSVSSNYTGATVVTGGKLIQVGTSQSASNQIDAGATLEFNVGAGTLSSGSTSFAGAGTLRKTGAGDLMWGTTSATFNFSHGALIHVVEGNLIGGSNWSEVWTNNHSDLRIDAGAKFSGVEADVRIDRLLGEGTLSTGLGHPDYHGFTIGVDGGDSLFTGTVVDSAVGDAGKLIKIGSGELVLTGTNTYSGGTTLHAGALRAGNNAAFGSGSMTLNAGVLSSDGTTARTLANAIVVGGNITLGDATKTGALTLSGAVDLGAGATLTTASDVTLGGAVISSGALIKDGVATLKLATTAVVTASVVVSDGLLTNNGAINGAVSVTANGTLGGSGTISGAVTINGTLAPGNSPGLQTQVAGDTTQAPGSHFLAQLGGITPGNGDGFHDQYFVQAGRFILDPGVTLDVRSWVRADGLTTFVPARRDIFAIIRASNGIAGQFSDLTNADYAQWVIYENNTDPADQYGYLYGTGLNGDQTFAAYGGSPARAAIGASLWAAAITPSASSTQAHPGAFLDGSTTLGQVAIGLLTAVDADAYLAALSPEAYLAVGDYALTVSRSLTDAAFAQSSLIKTGAWTVGAGYNRAQHGYVGAGSPGYQLSGDTGLVTVAYDFGPRCSVGFFYGQNQGKTVAANAHVDYRGGIFGLTSVGRIPGAYPVTLKGAVVASELRFDAARVGPTGAGSAVSHHPLRSLGGQLTAAVELHKDGRLTVSPTLGFVQGRSTTAAFAEAGAGANLSVDAMAQDSSRLVAGLGLTYLASTDLVFDLSAAYEHEFASDAGVVSASFLEAAQTVPMTMGRAIGDRASTTFGLGAAWKLDNSTTVRLGAEVRGNRELTKDYRYNATVNVRF